MAGTTLDNNFEGAVLSNAMTKGFTEVVVAHGYSADSDNTITIDVKAAPVNTAYTDTTHKDVTLEFTNWPSGTVTKYTSFLLQLTVDASGGSITIPASVTGGISLIQGLVPNFDSNDTLISSTITLVGGTYWFEFSSLDSGNSVSIRDFSRAPLANIPHATTADTATTVTANAQPNITSVGTLTALTVSGSTIGGKIEWAFNADAADSALIVSAADQPNITSVGTLTSLTVGGDVSAGSVSTSNVVVTGGTISGVEITDSTLALTSVTATVGITGNLLTADQPNITSVGTLTDLSVSGNIVMPSTGTITTGTITAAGGTFTGLAASNGFDGAINTGAQPNITSVGTLTDLSVSGNITTGTITSTVGTLTDLSVSGNITVSGTVLGSVAAVAPISNVGVVTDTVGSLAFDPNYLYVCVAPFDGNTAIWKRTTLTSF